MTQQKISIDAILSDKVVCALGSGAGILAMLINDEDGLNILTERDGKQQHMPASSADRFLGETMPPEKMTPAFTAKLVDKFEMLHGIDDGKDIERKDMTLAVGMYAAYKAGGTVPNRHVFVWDRQVWRFLEERDGVLVYASPYAVLGIPACYEGAAVFEVAYRYWTASPELSEEIRDDPIFKAIAGKYLKLVKHMPAGKEAA